VDIPLRRSDAELSATLVRSALRAGAGAISGEILLETWWNAELQPAERAFGSGALNRNIKSLLRRGRDYKNLRYLLLKAQRMAATKTELVVSKKQLKMQARSNSCGEP